MNEVMHERLRQPNTWRVDMERAVDTAIPSGFTDLDRALPGGGWPGQALTEILHDQYGIGELRLLMPALARLSRSGRWIAFVAPPHIPYAPALAAQGVDLSRVLLVHPRTSHRGRDALWALEQALRAGTCAAVVGWPMRVEGKQLRRLQLAAEAGDTWGILFREAAAADQPSPAALRLRLQQDEGGTLVSLLKGRGGLRRRQLWLDLDHPRVRSLPVPMPSESSPGQPPRPARSGQPGTSGHHRSPTSPSLRVPQLSLPLDTPSDGNSGHGRQRWVENRAGTLHQGE